MTEGKHTPDKLYASVDDLNRQEDWPGVTPFEECCDDLAGGAVVYVLETHEREASPDMLAALKGALQFYEAYRLHTGDMGDRARAIDAAIAKAGGRNDG